MTELRDLLAKATPGPWTIRPGGHSIENGTVVTCGAWGEYGCTPKEDAALIVYLRNHAEDIATLIEAARAFYWDQVLDDRHTKEGRALRAALAPFGDES